MGETADGAQAVTIAAKTAPDVVVMDIRMPVMDGLEATRVITGEGAGDAPRVLIVTTFDLDEYVFRELPRWLARIPALLEPLEIPGPALAPATPAGADR